MKKILSIACIIFVLAGAGLAGAQIFDEPSGKVSIMASGGTVYEDHTLTDQNINGGFTVASLTLPIGRYQISAKTKLTNATTTTNLVQCGLTGLTVNDNGAVTVQGGIGQTEMVWSKGVANLSVATNVEFFCNGSFNVNASLTVLHAVTVSAIVEQ